MFDVEGMDELIDRLSQIESTVALSIDGTLNEAGNNVKNEMRRLVKVSIIIT